MIDLNEVQLRTDITRAAKGFAYKKFLNKHIDNVKHNFNTTARRKLKYHSTMDDGRHVHHGIDNYGHHHYMLVNNDGHIQASVSAEKKGKSHAIEMTVAVPGAKVHHLYHHLITKHNHILTTKEQSHGGLSVWQKMRKMGGVNVHGYHTKSGKGQHVDIIHRPELSHVTKKELEVTRLTRGGTRQQKKKDYADLKKTQNMILVAHKDSSKKPLKAIKENTSSIIFRVIKESRR